MESVSPTQSLQLDPLTARAASALRKFVGAPRAVVSHFVFVDGDGKEVYAKPEDICAVLSDFRGSSSEEPETYLSRLQDT